MPARPRQARATHLPNCMADQGGGARPLIAPCAAPRRRQLPKRLGLARFSSHETIAAELAQPNCQLRAFDRILVDAPCSGLAPLPGHADAAGDSPPPPSIDLVGSAQTRCLEGDGALAQSQAVGWFYATCTDPIP